MRMNTAQDECVDRIYKVMKEFQLGVDWDLACKKAKEIIRRDKLREERQEKISKAIGLLSEAFNTRDIQIEIGPLGEFHIYGTYTNYE